MELLSPELEHELMGLSDEDQARFVFLEEHSEIAHHWVVNGFDPGFFRHFEGVLGEKRMLSPFSFPAFQERADEKGLRVVFIDDPAEEMAWAATLSELPEVTVNSRLPGTQQGMLPFQIQGYNFLKHSTGGVVNWSTGTGKTVLASALTRYHYDQGNFDLCLWVVKPHNKVNTQRSLKQFVGLDSLVVEGTHDRRQEIYRQAQEPRSILVLNYEKFRTDWVALTYLIKSSDLFVVWDEMPTKLKNRRTKLYKGVCSALYKSAPKVIEGTEWTTSLRQIMLSATPIEQNPEDFFNCVRLIDPTVYGTTSEFYAKFVRSWSPFQRRVPETWKNLGLMGAMAAPITHQVDKTDPDIAKQFPAVIEDIITVDLSDAQQAVYDKLMTAITEDGADVVPADMMSKIGVAQMLVDHPMAVLRSATLRADFEAELESGGFPSTVGSELAMRLVEIVGKDTFQTVGSAKFDGLKDVLQTLEPGEKGIIFTAFNASMVPLLSEALTKWGYKHVKYVGGMSAKAKQEAEDMFKNEPDCAIFLSSDAGSDSINLEVASMVVHFDLPWKWSTVVQRQNRAHRITSTHKTIRYIALLVSNSVEARKQAIIAAKQGYHDAIFKGAVYDQSEAMRLTNKDLLYILTGQ